ncbi:PREDICTED: uncharacterized protein LOC105561360 [Vollenhovia emeryi]|uniref:uncharacterized protein LOC105561360 n=1 Tax=Vollenhovia emeryi TaxID=411798 RepID=UPI0005F3C619|nr:PREDICTED: uncharacterized protein LOC105561360 [Vollenhovia emeryi]
MRSCTYVHRGATLRRRESAALVLASFQETSSRAHLPLGSPGAVLHVPRQESSRLFSTPRKRYALVVSTRHVRWNVFRKAESFKNTLRIRCAIWEETGLTVDQTAVELAASRPDQRSCSGIF